MQALVTRPGPAEFPPPVKSTIAWLNQRFRQWYAQHPIEMPDRHTRREFGYIPWPQYPGHQAFVRHLAFDSQAKLQAMLTKAGPHSVYYSTAYYARPGAFAMQDKKWWQAELIFDLDADHLSDVVAAELEGNPMPLEMQLALVKEQFTRLVDDFLMGDFGLSDKDIWLSFSGGRGYHAHVIDERMMQLGVRERREIADYVTAKVPTLRGSLEPDLASWMWERVVHIQDGKPIMATHIPSVDDGGWPGRITSTLVDLLRQNILHADRAAARNWVMSCTDLDAAEAARFVLTFNERMLGHIAQGNIEQGKLAKRVVKRLLATTVLQTARVQTDEPVTADIKRVIRLPGSVHGKTGLLCKRLTRDEIEDFEPMRDSLAFGFDPINIIPRQDNMVKLGGEMVTVKKGEKTAVPEAHGIFLAGRQQATVVP